MYYLYILNNNPTTTLQYKYKSRHKNGDKLTEGLKGDLYHILSYMPPEMGRYIMGRRWRGWLAGSLCCTWKALRISCPQDLWVTLFIKMSTLSLICFIFHVTCLLSGPASPQILIPGRDALQRNHPKRLTVLPTQHIAFSRIVFYPGYKIRVSSCLTW